MAKEQVLVPDIGGAEAAEVVELLVAPGDRVEIEQGLIVLESDKASMEIPSTVAGTLKELLVNEGDQLAEGAPIAWVETEGDAGGDESGDEHGEKAGEKTGDQAADSGAADGATGEDEAPAAAKAEDEAPAAAAPEDKARDDSDADAEEPAPAEPVAAQEAPSEAPPAEPTVGKPARGIYAGPAVRKLAREFGVDLTQVSGSGPRGRLLKEDLQGYVQKSLQGEASPAAPAAGAGIPPVPEIDHAAWGPVELKKRSRVDKLTAANMQRSWLNVPHVTHFDDIDITELETFRQSLKEEAAERGTRMTPLPFILKACAVALRQHPKFNAALADGGNALAFRDYAHIGMAVDTPGGLVVPVLRDVDEKPLWHLAEEVLSLAERARERKLKPEEMQGGCFTVSSLGALGGRGFTPIINTPEVGILAVGRAAVQPVWDGGTFQPRTLLPLGLSYDHRVINGGDAGRFMQTLGALLADVRRLLL